MKQLLFLFLLPCFALAQYPSNGNQKITLGEQSTADGLIFRGVAATDTVRKPSIDTMAYMVLDTTTNIMWHYKKAISNAWLRVGGSITSGLTGTLPVANGGTNATTLTANKVMVGNGTSGVLTPTNLHWDNSNSRLGLNISSPSYRLEVYGEGRFYQPLTNTTAYLRLENNRARNAAFLLKTTLGEFVIGVGIGVDANQFQIYDSNAELTRLLINSSGNIGIGTLSPQSGYKLHVVDSVYVGGNVSASAYTTRSDYNLKDDIFDIKYGLNDVLQLQPVEYTYKSNGSKQLGFIAQDIGTILPEVVSFEESMSVNYQAIIPILTKAIQEQQALIKALEQRIINLENK